MNFPVRAHIVVMGIESKKNLTNHLSIVYFCFPTLHCPETGDDDNRSKSQPSNTSSQHRAVHADGIYLRLWYIVSFATNSGVTSSSSKAGISRTLSSRNSGGRSVDHHFWAAETKHRYAGFRLKVILRNVLFSVQLTHIHTNLIMSDTLYWNLWFYFLFFTSFISKIAMHIIFRKGSTTIRELLSGEADWRREDSNPRPYPVDYRRSTVWDGLKISLLAKTTHAIKPN